MDNNFNYSISVDCVIFGYDSTDLKVLLIKRGEKPYLDYWALPGDLIHPKESVDDSVKRVLKDLTGLSNVYMEQVKTFGDVGRHPLGRVFTIAYYSLLKIDDYFGFNPGIVGLEALYKEGKMAIIHGCGYDNPSFSHFTSMAYMHTAAPNSGEEYGWIGRLADHMAPSTYKNFIVKKFIG